jgi:hypothetical protein
VKIVFIARHYSYLRLFESVIASLASRGHEILLAAEQEEKMGGRGLVERLAAQFPTVRLADAPRRPSGAWAEIARALRTGLDYLRYFDPRYADTPHLGARVRERSPRFIVALAETRLNALVGGRRGLGGLLRFLERGIPGAANVEQFIAGESPDVLMVTPLITIGSPQLDHFAAARRLGVRTVLPVASWDHLSSKALLRAMPDRVVVWNDMQRAEAVGLHGVPADRVVVTGAQCFDQWFGRAPSRSRSAFCERVGLRPDRPFVLYVCSSLFSGTADEPAIVQEWIRAVRGSSDPRLKDIGLLIRPHPSRVWEWKGREPAGYRNVAFFGSHAVDAQSKDDYFDSMYYSAAVVGVNTSAFVEAGIVGKPVHAIMLPEISRANQEGTIHFRYLLDVNGGLLRTATSFDEHVESLAASLAGEGGGDPKAARFVEGFVRPFGPDVPATPRFVEALEEVAARPAPPPERRGIAAGLAYASLYPLAAATALQLRAQPWLRRTRQRSRKARERYRAMLLRRIKQFASDRMMHSKTPAPPAAGSSSLLTPKARHQRDPAKTLAGTDSVTARETRELVRALGRSDRPILLGPWLSETGFELLYWIPFLAWAKSHANFDGRRLVAVSRGGAAPWYRHITAEYEDIFTFFTPDEFRAANERRIEAQGGRLKHVGISEFDREIVARVRQKRGLAHAELLHPSLMYELFDAFWLQRVPVTLVEAFTSYSMVPPGAGEGVREHLPERYVAAKFYANSALPDSAPGREFVAGYLADLAQTIDVVLLNTPHQFDDHSDFPPSLRGRIHRVEHLMRPERNLAVQTEIIRHAQAFVGTYGGFSYLAPLCGVNTLAFYSNPSGFRFDHLEVAKRVFAGLRCGTFVELDLRGFDALRLGFGAPLPSLMGK